MPAPVIDPSVPPQGTATTAAVRDNFLAIKTRIEALEAAIAALPTHQGAIGHGLISANQTILASGYDSIIFGDTRVTDSIFHDPVNTPTDFVIPAGYDGIYLITLAMSFIPTAEGHVGLDLNSSFDTAYTTWADVVAQHINHKVPLNSTWIVPLAAGDVVNAMVSNYTAGSLEITSTEAELFMVKLA